MTAITIKTFALLHAWIHWQIQYNMCTSLVQSIYNLYIDHMHTQCTQRKIKLTHIHTCCNHMAFITNCTHKCRHALAHTSNVCAPIMFHIVHICGPRGGDGATDQHPGCYREGWSGFKEHAFTDSKKAVCMLLWERQACSRQGTQNWPVGVVSLYKLF